MVVGVDCVCHLGQVLDGFIVRRRSFLWRWDLAAASESGAEVEVEEALGVETEEGVEVEEAIGMGMETEEEEEEEAIGVETEEGVEVDLKS